MHTSSILCFNNGERDIHEGGSGAPKIHPASRCPRVLQAKREATGQGGHDFGTNHTLPGPFSGEKSDWVAASTWDGLDLTLF